ncbi:MAG TPA: hypothetical protein VMG59_07740 [Phycisphaerae bacterium]|nr:hypothetical protein [Phycisphaerae bacterium]
MINNESSEIAINLAQEFIEFMHGLEPEWSSAFFRFSSEPDNYGSSASYVSNTKVTLIESFKNSTFFRNMNKKGRDLLKLLNKNQGVILLSVSRDQKYKIDFEFDNLNRWKISKLNGGTGVPEGFAAVNL